MGALSLKLTQFIIMIVSIIILKTPVGEVTGTYCIPPWPFPCGVHDSISSRSPPLLQLCMYVIHDNINKASAT